MDGNPKRIDISVLDCFSILHIIFPFLKGIKFIIIELFVAVPNPKLDHQAAKVAPRDVAAQLCLGRASLKLGRQDTFSIIFCLFIQRSHSLPHAADFQLCCEIVWLLHGFCIRLLVISLGHPQPLLQSVEASKDGFASWIF